MAKKKSSPWITDPKRLEELIEEGTVDCYDEEEQHVGMLTMVEENVVCPFQAKVIGETVTVEEFEWGKSRPGLYAVCQHKGKKHRVDITSLEWLDEKPEGFEWIEAYLLWRSGNV